MKKFPDTSKRRHRRQMRLKRARKKRDTRRVHLLRNHVKMLLLRKRKINVYNYGNIRLLDYITAEMNITEYDVNEQEKLLLSYIRTFGTNLPGEYVELWKRDFSY